MKNEKFSLLALTCAVSLLASSCHKDSSHLIDEEPRVYITKHNSSVDFASYNTFRISDSAGVIKDGHFLAHTFNTYDSTIISAITDEMVQRGYQLLTDSSQTPDIGINVSKIITDYSGVISNGDFWGGYGNYWDPYYWGYGGYNYNFPYTFDTYTFREGVLSIDMIDLRNPNPGTSKLNSIWSGLGYGTGIFNVDNINEEVQTLFNQSPYILQ